MPVTYAVSIAGNIAVICPSRACSGVLTVPADGALMDVHM